ncbi:MAG: hypothetical protein QGG36_04855 [Pirellulaceae bacterium]|nr:hypothetical protein [Pirellulaceae bacterium]MDP7015102.1 hypothetical protein [Pirellulaceae bacterium]
MSNWSWFELGLLALAAYIALTTLLKMVHGHHHSMIGELRDQWRSEQQRIQEEEARAKREAKQKEKEELAQQRREQIQRRRSA